MTDPYPPVPVAGQAGREAAVEAVARWLWNAHMGTDLDDVTSRITQAHYRTLATELLTLDAVAALSAAPGQEQGR